MQKAKWLSELPLPAFCQPCELESLLSEHGSFFICAFPHGWISYKSGYSHLFPVDIHFGFWISSVFFPLLIFLRCVSLQGCGRQDMAFSPTSRDSLRNKNHLVEKAGTSSMGTWRSLACITDLNSNQSQACLPAIGCCWVCPGCTEWRPVSAGLRISACSLLTSSHLAFGS